MNIDTRGWTTFDPASAIDVQCERERLAFTHYMLNRLKKVPKTGSDDATIMVGAAMAIVQMAFAMNGNAPPDTAREGLHDVLDFAWLQCVGMSSDVKDRN